MHCSTSRQSKFLEVRHRKNRKKNLWRYKWIQVNDNWKRVEILHSQNLFSNRPMSKSFSAESWAKFSTICGLKSGGNLSMRLQISWPTFTKRMQMDMPWINRAKFGALIRLWSIYVSKICDRTSSTSKIILTNWTNRLISCPAQFKPQKKDSTH